MVKNLKKLREEHGLSQQKLAEMLGTNPDGTIRRCFGIDL